MKSSVALWIMAALVAAGVGYAIGRPGAREAQRGEAFSRTRAADAVTSSAGVARQFDSWSKMDAEAVRAEYLSAIEGRERRFANVLLGRLAELDPEGALELAGEHGGEDVVFAAWVRVDADAAEEETRRRFAEDSDDRDMAVVVAVELVARDPLRAVRLMSETAFSPSEIDEVFAGWAHYDVEGATEAAIGWTLENKGGVDTTFLDGIVDELVQQDPWSAIEWYRSLPEEWRTDSEEIAERWAYHHHESALAALSGGRIEDEKLAKELAGELLDQVPERLSFEDAAQLLSTYEGTEEALEELGSTFHGREMAQLIDRAAARGVEWLDDEVIGAVAEEWAATDPRAAVEWAVGVGGSDDFDERIADACQLWAESDSRAALAWIVEKSDVFESPTELWYVMREIMEEVEPLDALAVVGDLASDVRDPVEARVVGALAAEDFSAARDYVEERGFSEPLLLELARGAVRGSEPGEAPALADWFAERAVEGEDASGLEHMLDLWTDSDVAAVSRWAVELEPGPARDEAVVQIASELRGTDPEAAYRWAETLGQREGRDELVAELWEEWAEFDPAGLESFLSGR